MLRWNGSYLFWTSLFWRCFHAVTTCRLVIWWLRWFACGARLFIPAGVIPADVRAKRGRSIRGRRATSLYSWPSGQVVRFMAAALFDLRLFHRCLLNHFSIMSATTTVISSKITPGFLAKSVLPQPILRSAQFSDYTTDKALSAYLQQMEALQHLLWRCYTRPWST
jgi:hypothetical protein